MELGEVVYNVYIVLTQTQLTCEQVLSHLEIVSRFEEQVRWHEREPTWCQLGLFGKTKPAQNFVMC